MIRLEVIGIICLGRTCLTHPIYIYEQMVGGGGVGEAGITGDETTEKRGNV